MKDTNGKFKVNLDMKDILVTEEQRMKRRTNTYERINTKEERITKKDERQMK